MNNENKTVNISLSKALLNAIDKQAEVEFRNRSDLIREAVRAYIASRGGMSTEHKLTTTEHGRIKEALNFTSLKDEPAILLSCAFRPQPNFVKDIFKGGSKVIELVENPPRFRRMGWDLQTLDRARPVAGEYLEVANGKRKLLRLYRDGQHTLAAGMDFFGHAVNKGLAERTNFNLLAVAECIANFVVFSKQVSSELLEESNALIFTVAISNPTTKPLKLHAYDGLGTDKVGELELEWAERNIIIINPGTVTDMKMAYQVYAELCYFFGMNTNEFWYVDKDKLEVRKEDFVKQG